MTDNPIDLLDEPRRKVNPIDLLDEPLPPRGAVQGPPAATGPVQGPPADPRWLGDKGLLAGYLIGRGAELLGLGTAGVMEGAALGGSDELAGLASMATGGGFEEGRQRELGRLERIPPAIRTTLNIAGGAAIPGAVTAKTSGLIAPGAARTVQDLSLPVTTALTAAEGAAQGALSGEGAEGRVEGAIEGGLAGAVLGLTVPLTIGGLQRAVNAFRAGGATNAEIQAADNILRSLRNDELTVGQARNRLNALGDPAMLADVGPNVRQRAQTVLLQPGPGAKQGSAALRRRSREFTGRLARATSDILSGNQQADDVVTMILDERKAVAAPLYDRARAVGSKATVESEELQRIVANSRPIRRAVNEARDLNPDWAGLPDTDIRLLDQAYKNLGGKANAARVSGDSVLSHNLNKLRHMFREAIVKEVPVYGEALDEFSARSSLLDALKAGQDAFGKNPMRPSDIRRLPRRERDMFKIGLADAIEQLTAGKVDVAQAKALVRTEKIRSQLRGAFADDRAGFIQFMRQINRELEFAETAGKEFGSRTANVLLDAEEMGQGIVGDAAQALTGGPRAQAGFLARRLGGGSRRVLDPEVSEAMGRMLFSPGGPARESALGRLAMRERAFLMRDLGQGATRVGAPLVTPEARDPLTELIEQRRARQ